VAGLLALAGASLLPKKYESTAVLGGDLTTVAIMQSAPVLDPIARSLGYTANLSADEARLKLKVQINASINTKDKLLTLKTTAETPQAAQALAKAVLEQTYVESQPRDSAKERLLKQLAQAQIREKEANQTAILLAGKMEKTGGEVLFQVAQGYAQMIGVVKESQSTQIEIERQLKGLDNSA
jgi:hypothetical protein